MQHDIQVLDRVKSAYATLRPSEQRVADQVLADPVVIYFYHEQTSWMMLFSPVNWSSIENLKKYSGEGMLTSVYVYAVSLSICAILMMVIKEKTREMDL